jgi:ATP-binding cassette subfamily F protein uup
VVTSTLVFEGEGLVREYVGGYQDWLRQGGSPRLLGVGESKAGKPALASAVVPAQVAVEPEAAVASKKKLSYKLQRELEAIPAQIEVLEAQVASLQEQIGAPSFYQQSAEKTAEVLAQLQATQSQLELLVERWSELEG